MNLKAKFVCAGCALQNLFLPKENAKRHRGYGEA
jgi:hypothetical protein